MRVVNLSLSQLEGGAIGTEADMLVDGIKRFGSTQEEGQCLFKDVAVDLLGGLNELRPIELRCHLCIEFVEFRWLRSGTESAVRAEELAMHSYGRCLPRELVRRGVNSVQRASQPHPAISLPAQDHEDMAAGKPPHQDGVSAQIGLAYPPNPCS